MPCVTNLSFKFNVCVLFILLALCEDVKLPVLSEAMDVMLPASADVVIVVIFGTGALCVIFDAACKAVEFKTSPLPIMKIVDCASPLPLSSLADESSRV